MATATSISILVRDVIKRLYSFCLYWTISVGKKEKKKETCIFFFSSDRKRRRLRMFVGYIKKKPSSNIYEDREQLEPNINARENKYKRRQAHGKEAYLSEEGVVI